MGKAVLQTGQGKGFPAKSEVSITLRCFSFLKVLAPGPIGLTAGRTRAAVRVLAVQFHLYDGPEKCWLQIPTELRPAKQAARLNRWFPA